MRKENKTIIILVVVLLAAILLPVVIILAGRPFPQSLDPQKYESYKYYDSNLCCLDAEDNKDNSAKVRYGTPKYSMVYRKPVGTSDDQFICVKYGLIGGAPNLAIFQNPENYIDVWTDWTIKEIQVYFYDHQKSVFLYEENEPCRTPSGIVVKTVDAACISDLLQFISAEKYSFYKPSYEDTIHQICYDGSSVNTSMFIRVLFNESESIIWDAEVECFVDMESNKRFVTIKRMTEIPDRLSDSAKRIVVEDLPNLEAFLLDAVDALIEELNIS